MSKCYILQTPANWFFRRAVPSDLREQIGKREIKVSLRTGSKAVATHLARDLVNQTDTLFQSLRGGRVMPKQITIPGVSELLLESKKTFPDGSISEQRIDISPDELQLLMQAGYSNQLAEKILSRITELSTTAPDTDNLPAISNQPPINHSTRITPPHQEVDCAIDYDSSEDINYEHLRLSEAIKRYMEFGVSLDRWKNDKITGEAKADLVLLVDVIGDRPLGAVTPAMALKFRQAITRIPKRRKLAVKYRDRKLKDLINDTTIPESDLFGEAYVNSLLISCSSLFNWAFKGKYNPFSDLRKKDRRSKTSKRDSFTSEELLLIFSHKTFTGRKPNKVYQYWAPLIALLTGMRQTEIAQLTLADIYSRDGVYGIRIDETTPDQTAKNEKSRRFVPIHHKLLELGFQERVERLAAIGATRLFPELYLWETDPNRDRPGTKVYVGQTISKWFNGPKRFLDSLGLIDAKLTFHSLRKNFITEMTLKRICKEDRTAIVGHEDSDAHDIYITEYNYAELKTLVDKVDFSSELINVKPWNPDWK